MDRFVDVSNNNKGVDFAKIKAAGAVGVYLKVTEGLSFVDPDYVAYRKAAKAAGLRVGGYHFAHPENDPAKELAFFLSHLILEPGDFLPALDLEDQDKVIWTRVNSFALSFLRGLKAKAGQAVLYSGEYFMKSAGLLDVPFRKWVPDYGAKPWAHYDAWQYTDGLSKYGPPIDGLDTSYVLDLPLLVYKAPFKKKSAAYLRKLVGYKYWVAWRLGAGPFHGWGKAVKSVRPNVPHKISAAWWKLFRSR